MADLVALAALLGYVIAGWRGLSGVFLPIAVFGALLFHTMTFRYLVFLVLARRILPWRLGRFLRACHRAGILRTSGAAYQFRHLELQDHLAGRQDRPGGEPGGPAG
ncbi:hypothetical protein STANM309S_02894 [Streptomyces tanashiensis]